MGKRSNFDREDRDYYPTPYKAFLPLIPHLPEGARFCEPCAGDGRLKDYIKAVGLVCAAAYDIEPQRSDIKQADALVRRQACDIFITNPPWKREILHPLIMHLSDQAPAWLLFDSDWKDTVQAKPYLHRLHVIQSVGRVKWIPGSKHSGKDNASWYLFSKHPRPWPAPLFLGRQ